MTAIGERASVVGDGWRLARGVRRLLREPGRVDAATVVERVAAAHRRRSEAFLDVLAQAVWPFPSSPLRRLLDHAGVGPADVEGLVRTDGLEPALGRLRDDGVYVTYDEWLGKAAVRRGSLSFETSPADFWNPARARDYLTRTGGSRSGGTPVARSFEDFGPSVERAVLRREVWGVSGAPTAVWLPGFPSAGGLNTVLRHQLMGQPVERWFTPAPRGAAGVGWEKRLANILVPVVGWTAGARLPLPRYVAPSDPAPVLDWCQDALRRHGRAILGAYTTSAVQLARLATSERVSLEGLVVFAAGEPLTAARASVLRESGAAPANVYSFTQHGSGGYACPHCPDEEVHVAEHRVAVVTRATRRPDGVEVNALCWTSVEASARSVFLNVENDDYGALTLDAEACPCLLGRLGFRRRLRGIRGVSKVVAGGVTVPGEVFEELAERILPDRFGGEPGRWQFAEEDGPRGARLVVRADPSIGDLDAAAVLDAVNSKLQQTEPGALAGAVWADGGLRVERVAPKPTRSGKVLPYEPLSSSRSTRR